jgi:hypothetical protein
MKNEFIFPETTSEEIDKNIENDSNIREGSEIHYLYPQKLYYLLLQKKNINIRFIKRV